MNLERGFRRLFIVLSVAVLGAGIALDAGKLWSHAKIYATLDDGRTQVFDTWSLVGSPPYERDPSTRRMVAEFIMNAPLTAGDFKPVPPPEAPGPSTRKSHVITDPALLAELNAPPHGVLNAPPRGTSSPLITCRRPPCIPLDPEPETPIHLVPVIQTFRVVRGPSAWSWEDVRFTPIAGGIVLLLWAGFFAVRWVARGFMS